VRYTPYGSPRRLNMNSVDIAFDDGSALPPVGTATAGNVNNGVETGDYNLFLATFFDSLPAADVANDDGTPLPPFGPLGVNNGVTEGDYNLFFAKFYDGGADEPGLSAPEVANTIGYAGYEHDPILLTPSALSADPNQSSAAYYHVRHRVYDTNLGRWTRRDPLGYVDGMGLYEYVAGVPLVYLDPFGLVARVATTGPLHHLNAFVLSTAGIARSGFLTSSVGVVKPRQPSRMSPNRMAACAQCMLALIDVAIDTSFTRLRCEQCCERYVCVECPSDREIPPRGNWAECNLHCGVCCSNYMCTHINRLWKELPPCIECATGINGDGLNTVWPPSIASCRPDRFGIDIRCDAATFAKLSRCKSREAWTDGCPKRPVSKPLVGCLK